MIFPQHFIVEGKYLGMTPVGYRFIHGEKQYPCSYAFFCPSCAEVWARCPVEIGANTSRFQVITRGCRKHPQHELEIPGSLWTVWDKTFNDGFPDGLMQWELDRHLALYDNDESTA